MDCFVPFSSGFIALLLSLKFLGILKKFHQKEEEKLRQQPAPQLQPLRNPK